MNKSQILERKRAGAGGSIGAAVAKEFAAEGAEVFLAGRTQANVEGVVKQIMADGGCAHAAVTDAVDDVAVDGYIDGVARQTGRIDILFNAIGPLATEYGNGKNAVDLTVEEYMVPLTIVKSQFITARAAARQMVKQRSGAIIFLTGSPARGHVEGATAIGAAFGAIESFMENLAVEIGPVGVRAVCLRTTANTDSRTI
jgi:3-oxoacyl-[acyl-carrier protein] reductase